MQFDIEGTASWSACDPSEAVRTGRVSARELTEWVRCVAEIDPASTVVVVPPADAALAELLSDIVGYQPPRLAANEAA